MQAYDTIFLLIVLATAFYGWRKGLSNQVASIVSLVVSSLVAMRYQPALAPKINLAPPLNMWAASIVLFMGTAFVIWIVFRQIRSSIEAMKLGEFDYQMGAVLGAAKGFLIASILTVGAYSLLGGQSEAIIRSKSAYAVAQFLGVIEPMIPTDFHGLIAPYLARFEMGIEGLPPDGYPPVGGYGPPGRPSSYDTPMPPSYGGPPGGTAGGSLYPPSRDPGYLPPGATPWQSGTQDDWRATSGDERRF